MQSGDFFKRFTHDQEIGRDITDSHVSVFYDNGRDVGMWREERTTTVGAGSVLSPDDAAMARYWYASKIQDQVNAGPATAAGRVIEQRLNDSAHVPSMGRKR
jgi:hypothetical protein